MWIVFQKNHKEFIKTHKLILKSQKILEEQKIMYPMKMLKRLH